MKHFKEPGPYGTNMLRFHSTSSYEYTVKDRMLRETCCAKSELCDEFYKRRPQNDCHGYQPQQRCMYYTHYIEDM